MKSKVLVVSVLACLAAAWLVPASSAQDKVQDPAAHEYVVRAITLAITVIDSKGRFINNLTEKDFTVFENNKKKPITYFMHDFSAPLSLTVLLDVSGSMALEQQARGLQGRSPRPGRARPPPARRDRPAPLRGRPGRGGRQAFDRQVRVPPGPREDRSLRPDRPQRRRGRFPRVRDQGQERENGPSCSSPTASRTTASRPRNRPSRSPGASTSPSTRSATRSPATNSSRPTSVRAA